MAARELARQHGDSLTVVAAVAVAGDLGLHGIARKSVWLDEAFSVALARQDLAGMWRVISSLPGPDMPLYYVILHVWLHLGTSEAVVRSLSVAAAAATVLPLYALEL